MGSVKADVGLLAGRLAYHPPTGQWQIPSQVHPITGASHRSWPVTVAWPHPTLSVQSLRDPVSLQFSQVSPLKAQLTGGQSVCKACLGYGRPGVVESQRRFPRPI